MSTLAQRITDLAAAVRDKFNTHTPRLMPAGGNAGQVLKKSSATDYDAAWSNAPGGTYQFNPGSGNYISNGINASSASQVASAANRFEAAPLILGRDYTINALELAVVTLAASTSAHVGIYSDNNGAPGNLIIGTTTALDCSTTGVKSATITNTTLTAGTLYWVVVFSSGAPTIRGVPLTGCMILTPFSDMSAFMTTRRATLAFGALPSAAPATTAQNTIAPFVRMKVA